MSLSKQDFFKHLQDQGCYMDENGSFPQGAYYINCINNDICYIEYHNRYTSLMCYHICYEFKIPAPLIFEDDYEIYKLYRKKVSYSQKKENEIFKKR